MIKVAIVTVDYNGHGDTADLLDSAVNLDTQGLETLWLVVDNGSDTSIKKTIGKFKNAVWLQTGKNLGFTGGFNRGMKYAKEWGADYILIINNDTLIGDKLLIKKLLKVFTDNPNAGMVSPKIYFAPKHEFYKERYQKKDEGKVIWYAGGIFDWDNVRSIHRGIDEIDTGKFDAIERTGFVTGCCILIKRDVFEKVGFLQEKLFAYFEDNDWIKRMTDAGFEQWYNGTTYIYHKVSKTAGIGSSWTDYLITRNRMWFGMKYANIRTKFALLRESIRFLISGRSPQKKGIIDYFKGVYGYKNSKQPDKVEYPLELSIIVINYKTTKLTLDLLSSIFNKKSGLNEIKRGAEVIVLDNSPEEPCRKQVLDKFPGVKFISNSINNGFPKGNNQMINYSLGKYVLLLNSDIIVKENALTELLNAVYRYGERAIYAGKLFYPDGSEQESIFKLPTIWGAFSYYFLGRKDNYFINIPTASKISKVEGAIMACYLLPWAVINEIGLLEEFTFTFFEDIDYARRAKKANIPIYFVPEAKFIHLLRASSQKAGAAVTNTRMISAAKWYHGRFNYSLITFILWAGQKWEKIGRLLKK
jgi:GT2 family glycosyltransferase